MQTITMTELRIKPKELLQTLGNGKSVDLIHRSRLIATIQPKSRKVKVFDAREFKQIVDRLKLPHLTLGEMDRRYREAMMKKHGKYLL